MVEEVDVVGPPTLTCPQGLTVQRCHGMEYCGFSACTTDAQWAALAALAGADEFQSDFFVRLYAMLAQDDFGGAVVGAGDAAAHGRIDLRM